MSVKVKVPSNSVQWGWIKVLVHSFVKPVIWQVTQFTVGQVWLPFTMCVEKIHSPHSGQECISKSKQTVYLSFDLFRFLLDPCCLQNSFQKQQTQHTIDGSFIIFCPKKTTIAIYYFYIIHTSILEYYHAVVEASFFFFFFFQENALHDIN